MRRDNWMSDTIQSEILEMLAHAIQREIMSEIALCSYLGLTADVACRVMTCSNS